MDPAIQPKLRFGLGQGLRARLGCQMGLTGAASLLHRPLLRVLLGVGLEAPHSVDGAGVEL